MDRRKQGISRWVGAGLLMVGSLGCIDGEDKKSEGSEPDAPTGAAKASLTQASDCTDLLTKIQNDAIAKLKLAVAREKALAPMRLAGGGRDDGVPTTPGIPSPSRDAGASAPLPSPSVPGRGDVGGGTTDGVGSSPPTAPQEESESDDDGVSAPVGSSDTNSQVAGVDEADFVKVVDSGKGIYLLHGSTLQKLKSWPAAETALVGKPLVLEGSPSEMFVTDEGKAVVFSSVYGYGGGPYPTDAVADIDCDPMYCKGYGAAQLKVTVADVSGAEPRVERELYYEGSYVSSRRYEDGDRDVVRAVVQAGAKYSGLYQPDIEWSDAWGRPYDQANIEAQLDGWEARTTAAIRKTTLAEWLPRAQERQNGQLVDLAPTCNSYFVPAAGQSEHGLTHVLSLDTTRPSDPVGGVTIVGATSTVYSNAERLVLAQPDYRWFDAARDFGVADAQQTALHVFELAGARTTYLASGLVPGQLPLRNPQFGIDVAADGTIRLATTGLVRAEPDAERDEPEFWQQRRENHVLTARVSGRELALVGKSPNLGHEGDSVYSSRFVGDRAYVVTFRQIDPLIVVDLKNPQAPTVLGELEIPGFSEYMHPLDATHLLTAGQSGNGGIQLQIFDVTNPESIPQPKTFGFGQGTSSSVSFDHKAFTFYQGILAMPVQSYGYTSVRRGFQSALELVKVDASAGFAHLGTIDHSSLYADNGAGVQCGRCDAMGCYDFYCGYRPEVRRGHFVASESTTYVYSFSHAGVLVNDLARLATPVARVGLPSPIYTGGSYPGGGLDGGIGKPVPATPPDAVDPVLPVDGGAARRDAGSASASDAGSAPTMTP